MTKAAGIRQTMLLIAWIDIGPRFRREMGDIDELAADIAGIDMLQPIVVRPDGRGRYELACGARRLAAAKQNGETHILATVRDLTDAEMARAEFSENIHRKPFTLSEAVAAKRKLEPMEREAAQQRMRAGRPLENFSEGKGRALDKIAKVAGISRITLARAEAVVDAAEAEPEKYGRLKDAMDKTGRVNSPFKRLHVARQAEKIRAEPPPLPGRGPYRVGVVDFPWPYEIASEDSTIRGVWPYPTMSINQIRAFPITSIMHEDSILWVWTTNYHMQVVADLLRGWGFRHVTILTWAKDHAGSGDWLRGQTEHAVMAVRGKPVVTLVGQSTLLLAPVRAHSQKPVEFYDLVESLCPAPRYADFFSRYKHNDKWDCHGDQAPTRAQSLETAPALLAKEAE